MKAGGMGIKAGPRSEPVFTKPDDEEAKVMEHNIGVQDPLDTRRSEVSQSTMLGVRYV